MVVVFSAEVARGSCLRTCGSKNGNAPAHVAVGSCSIVQAKLQNTLHQLAAYPPITSQQQASFVRFTSRTGRTPTQVNRHSAFDMNTIDNQISISANSQIELIQHVMLSRYFTAAGVVIVLYDTILTIEDEVNGFRTQPFMLHSLSTGSPGLATAFRSFAATLLHQPVLDDCVLDSCQLSWVARTPGALWRTYTTQSSPGFDHRCRPM